MAVWVGFERDGVAGLGTVESGTVHVHSGGLFDAPRPTGETVPLAGLELAAPFRPSKYVGLVSNYRAAAAKVGGAIPEEPLYFLKAPSAYLSPGRPIRLPAADVGKIIYEGELGVVIGRTARDVSEAEADGYVFGYTCVNDVTALDLLSRDPAFAQWTRAKSFDTFGPFGPFVATGLDPEKLAVRTVVNGKVRQDYPCGDMIFGPRALVSRLSREMTLLPGDLIACGTSVGIGVLRPGQTVEVAIDGIGVLANAVEAGTPR